MDIKELDSKLATHIEKSRNLVRARVEKYGLQSEQYHDETIDMCNYILDSMDAFRIEIIQYLKETK